MHKMAYGTDVDDSHGHSGDEKAEGEYPWTWLGWVLAAVGVGSPILGGSLNSKALAWAGGLTGVLGAVAVFGTSMASDAAYTVSADGRVTPLASFTVLPDGDGLRAQVAFTMPF